MPVKKYIENDLKLKETDDEKFYYSEYDADALSKIIDTQRKMIEYQKRKIIKNMWQILIVIDDFADSPEFSRNSK